MFRIFSLGIGPEEHHRQVFHSACFPCQPRTAGTRGSGPRPRAAATRSSRMASLEQPLPRLLLCCAQQCSAPAADREVLKVTPATRAAGALPGGRSGGGPEEGKPEAPRSELEVARALCWSGGEGAVYAEDCHREVSLLLAQVVFKGKN